MPDDRTILVESFVDPAGELGLAVLTPFGGRLHHALKLALSGGSADRSGPLAGVPARRMTVCCSACRRWTSRRSTCSTGSDRELAERLIREELPEYGSLWPAVSSKRRPSPC